MSIETMDIKINEVKEIFLIDISKKENSFHLKNIMGKACCVESERKARQTL